MVVANVTTIERRGTVAGDKLGKVELIRRLLLENPDGIPAKDLAARVGVHRTIVYGYLNHIGARSLGRKQGARWVFDPSDSDVWESEQILRLAGKRGRAAARRVLGKGDRGGAA